MKRIVWASWCLFLGLVVIPFGVYVEYIYLSRAVETKGVIFKQPSRYEKRIGLRNEIRWKVFYQFKVDGINYEGSAEVEDNKLPEAIKSHWWRNEPLSNVYEVTVYYDPHNIKENRLEKPSSYMIWGACFLFVLFIYVAIIELRDYYREKKP